MLNDNVQESLAGQVSAELYSAYLYFAISNYFESQDLPGLSKWARRQAVSELGHASDICRYVASRGGCISLRNIEAPPSACATPMVALDEVRHHEERVTGMLNDLINLAHAQKDHATVAFLMRMAGVQVREETRVTRLRQRLQSASQLDGALLAIDHDLSQHSGAASTRAMHEHNFRRRRTAPDSPAD